MDSYTSWRQPRFLFALYITHIFNFALRVNALPWPMESGALACTISIGCHRMGIVVTQISVGMLSMYVWKSGTHFVHVQLVCQDLI